MTRRAWVAAGAGVLVVAVVIVAVAGSSGGERAAAAAHTEADTAPVQRGELAAAVSQDGTLSYRARPDGSPYALIGQARGTYTALPEPGDEVACGGVLYRVDDRPVLLLCGAVPAYRALHAGDTGRDVGQLNRNLRVRGSAFTSRTVAALGALQRRRGLRATGVLARADATFLPGPVRIAKVTTQLGASAQPGATIATATSNALHVQVNLAASDQGQVKKGDRARVTLPGNVTLAGRVAGFGRVAAAPSGQGNGPSDATLPTYISLDQPRKARGLDRAPVGVEIATRGVANALSVPVTALVGKSGGGFAVEVARSGGRRALVGVKLGLFDTAGGRVQVEGGLRQGDRVSVPSL